MSDKNSKKENKDKGKQMKQLNQNRNADKGILGSSGEASSGIFQNVSNGKDR
jgi:hypothetical protein